MDDAELVETMEKVNVGPTTPLIVDVEDPPLAQPPTIFAHGTWRPDVRGAIVLLAVLTTQ